MRIATVVVVSVAVLCSAAIGSAKDPGGQVDRMLCSQSCDSGYESCMRWRTGKGTQDCPGDLLRCRKGCDPTGEGAAAAKNAPPRSCREACLADFSDCVSRSDGKQRQDCAQTVMVCRQGCPPEPDESAAAPALPVAAPPAPAAAAAAPPAPAAAAAPAAAPVPQPIAPREVTAPASVREERVEHAAPAPEAVAVREPAPVAPPADTVRTRPATDDAPAATTASRGNVFARAWCAVSGSCRGISNVPLNCQERCDQTYDACAERANPKRGGECAPALMRCRQGCEM